MLTKSQFQSLTEKAKKFKYSSFNHLDYDDCLNAQVLENAGNLILMSDKKDEKTYLHWAANAPQSIIQKTENIKGTIRINFVPKEFVSALEDAGFSMWAEFVDFFNESLINTDISVTDYDSLLFLQPEQAAIAEAISKSCAGQSRGFTGETKEWFCDWLKENDVIIIKAGEETTGFCCVSIYANGTILWVREIAVNPQYQRQGFGKKLLEQAICYGIKKGAQRGFLHADIQNKNAIALYNKFNFHAKTDDGEIQMIRN